MTSHPNRGRHWRPISTAPKDGSEFLAYWIVPATGEGQTVIAKWTSWGLGEIVGVNVRNGHGDYTVSSLTWGFPKAALCATHWQPLPKAPV